MITVTVKQWMTNYPTFMDENSFLMKNNVSPMPLCRMYGEILMETPKMYKMKLHGDIKDNCTICMKCGRKLTNNVSKYFGIGPECGDHNYTNPFESKEELQKAVKEMREKVRKITWEGFVLKSGIKELTGDLDVIENNKRSTEVKIRVGQSNKIKSELSLFVSFDYDGDIVSLIKEQPIRYYNSETKEWELPTSSLDEIKSLIIDVVGEKNLIAPSRRSLII